MKPSDRGAVSKRLMAIQFAIVAGLAAFYFLYLPYRTKSQAEAKAEERELKIEALFESLVVEDAHTEVEATGTGGKVHPQRLNRTPAVDELVQELGLPNRRTADFRGGLHITWTGTAHSLEAAFDHGRLYCLRHEDLRTGHGALVFESSSAWRPF
ncbi:hypothetical protein SBA2_270089 [Acidobacteriia bacterium SbA2]|nr:hypothetical protein SBA2_270089 [Acidobacteriia bacterium SbA2]